MKSPSCSRCAGERVEVKEVELRRINLRNKALASRQYILEIECLDCEYVDILDQETALSV